MKAGRTAGRNSLRDTSCSEPLAPGSDSPGLTRHKSSAPVDSLFDIRSKRQYPLVALALKLLDQRLIDGLDAMSLAATSNGTAMYVPFIAYAATQPFWRYLAIAGYNISFLQSISAIAQNRRAIIRPKIRFGALRMDIIRGSILGLALLAVATPVLSAETITYTYDAKGRLVKVERAGTVNNGVKIEYIHDKADNRQNVKVTGSPNPPPP